MITVFVGGAGQYELTWDGTDESGKIMNAGLYPYSISIGDKQSYGIMEKL